MSTYKVAFAVVSFPYEQVENDRLAVRSSFWSRQEVYEEMDYVVRFSRQLVYIFQTNFDMKYSLPKLDIIAVPKYAVPIKENWGVVIWQEEYLLQITTGLLGYNPEIFGVVAKQMVRQWVSNLVTLETWEDAWFVEGFCRYFAEVAVDEFIFPDLEWLSYEITANHISVLEFDSLRNARAVSYIQCG